MPVAPYPHRTAPYRTIARIARTPPPPSECTLIWTRHTRFLHIPLEPGMNVPGTTSPIDCKFVPLVYRASSHLLIYLAFCLRMICWK